MLTRVAFVLACIGLAAAAAMSTGCAGMMASWREANCNYDGAFKAGMNDARAGQQMRGGFSQPCDPAVQAEADGVITAWIAFETKAGRGSGLLRLVGGKAFTLLTTLDELKGHEEPVNDRRPKGVRRPRASVFGTAGSAQCSLRRPPRSLTRVGPDPF